MLGLLAESGFILVNSDAPAEVKIINTCGFIADARQEALENIAQAIEEKLSGKIGHVVVAGCLAQFWGKKLLRQFPDISAIVQLAQRDRIAEITHRLTTANAPSALTTLSFRPEKFSHIISDDHARLRLTEPCWCYLRISEGCDRRCSFCTIPMIRGPYRSKPLSQIIDEARELVADGAVELNLIGQETSLYGLDLPNNESLASLIRQLNQIDGLKWLRILYTHPASITDELIDVLAESEKAVPYLDIPLQHINDRILQLMHRRINRCKTETILKKLRQAIDNIIIRTTMLVGFPSETEAEFAELLDFIRRQRFEALGCFIYSREAGTLAARISDQITDELKHSRHERVMLAQQEIAFAYADSLIGTTLATLIIRPMGAAEICQLMLDSKKSWFLARHSGQAPEIDSECYLASDNPGIIEPGEIKSALITARVQYDLVGNIKP